MILVGSYGSPFVRRVAITMKLLDIPFELRALRAADDADALRTINPVGRVPALILDDGEVLIESAAILDYLDERVGPERALTPPSGTARRKVNKLVALATGAAEKTVAAVYEGRFRPKEIVHQPWVDRVEAQAASALAALEAEAGEPWLAGERMTQADVTAAVIWYFIAAARPHLLPAGRYPKLAALADRLGKLPAFTETKPG